MGAQLVRRDPALRGGVGRRCPERECFVELARAGFCVRGELVGNLAACLIAPDLGAAERREGVDRDFLVHVAGVPSPFGAGRAEVQFVLEGVEGFAAS